MSDIADAYEASYTIMLNLNRSWISKQGDFFVESPIILLAAIIWYLRIYQGGKYCTFPHAIELLNKKYADVFTILRSYRTGELPFSIRGCLGEFGGRTVTGANSQCENPAFKDDKPGTLLGNDGR